MLLQVYGTDSSKQLCKGAECEQRFKFHCKRVVVNEPSETGSAVSPLVGKHFTRCNPGLGQHGLLERYLSWALYMGLTQVTMSTHDDTQCIRDSNNSCKAAWHWINRLLAGIRLTTNKHPSRDPYLNLQIRK